MGVEGILGRKVGMTQIYDDTGAVIPVTVIEAGPCPVLLVRSAEKDGYASVQVGLGAKRPKTVTRQMLGHAKKAGLENPPRFIRELPVSGEPGVKQGEAITVSIFKAGEKVKVTGTSKGRGFAGTIKRHHFSRGPDGHGSKNVRAPGCNGAATTPGKTLPGTRRAGHLGMDRVTIRMLDLVKVDEAKNLLVIRGAIPGPNGGLVMVRRGG